MTRKLRKKPLPKIATCMKKLIAAALALVTALALSPSGSAQIAIELDEEQLMEEMIHVYNVGQSLENIGKTFFYTGAGLAAAGVALYLIEVNRPSTDDLSSGVASMIGVVSGISGAIVAFAGLPYYLIGGNTKNKGRPGEYYFGDVGWTGMAELGITNFSAFSANAIGGYSFNHRFFAGAGIGFKGTDFGYSDSLSYYPLYANLRYSFGKSQVVPYVAASVGTELSSGALYTGLDVGARKKVRNGNRGASWWFTFGIETISGDTLMSLKVGRSF